MKTRIFEMTVGESRAEDGRIEASLSSEFPVKRFDGNEVLIHEESAVDLSRAPLPLIVSHESRDLPVGVVEGIKVIGRKLRGFIRFGESARAKEILADVKAGILRNVSIGYTVQETERQKDGYRVIRWTPYEISLVSVPADSTVGIGRNFKPEKENRKMDRNDILQARQRAVEELENLIQAEDLDETLVAERKAEIENMDKRLALLDDLEKFKGRKAPEKPERPGIPTNPAPKVENRGGPCITIADKKYVRMFGEPRTNHGFRDAQEYCEVLNSGRHDARLVRAMTEGTGSAGGFSVPDEFSAQWLDDNLESEIVRPRATVWPMKSATRKVPAWDGNDRSSGVFGGLNMEMLEEAGEGTAQSGKLRLNTLTAHKGAIFVDISQELHDDGLGFDAQLQGAMGKSIGYGFDNYFFNGTGAGQALGITNADSLITVDKESGQTEGTIVYQNLAKMFARMYPAGRLRGIWIANSDTIPALMTVTIAVETGGNHVEVFKESNGRFTIFGREVVFTEHLPTLGSENDILFVDLSQYSIGLRKEMVLDKSNIPGWTQDLMSYRVITRFDGMPAWDSVITPKNGATLSWAVGLAER